MLRNEWVNRLWRSIRSEFGHGGGVNDFMAGLTLVLCFMTLLSGLSSWKPFPLLWTFILLCDHIVTIINEVCSCPHEGMNLWHLRLILWQNVWFAWTLCTRFVTTQSRTILLQMLPGHLWFTSNMYVLIRILNIQSNFSKWKRSMGNVGTERC